MPISGFMIFTKTELSKWK